jgi:pilus assembly protein Flp/PilA
MKVALLRLYVRARMLREEGGQDLVEYALVVALIALAATAGMSALAGNINSAFAALGTKMGAYTS